MIIITIVIIIIIIIINLFRLRYFTTVLMSDRKNKIKCRIYVNMFNKTARNKSNKITAGIKLTSWNKKKHSDNKIELKS